jgi:hypothetical protein
MRYADDLDDERTEASEEDDEWGHGKGHDPRCGATWFGHRIEHCTVCHQTFSGERTGMAHRVGQHDVWEGPERRRCLSADELTALGLWAETNPYGTHVWHGTPNKAGKQLRHPKHQELSHG